MPPKRDVDLAGVPEDTWRLWDRERSGAWIFWVSVVSLYLELLLIRWVTTEIRIFAYLQNTVLVTCFLGLGIGLFTARRPIRLGRSAFALAILAGLLSVPLIRDLMGGASELLSVLGDINIFYGVTDANPLLIPASVALGSALTLIVMVLLCDTFVPFGRLLGRLMDEHPRPILAYSLNVGGSLVGTWTFVVLSWLQLPPVLWFLALLGFLLPFLGLGIKRPKRFVGALVTAVALIGILGPDPSAVRTVWSPYQKLELLRPEGQLTVDQGDRGGNWEIQVNNVEYQAMLNLDPAVLARQPERHPAEEIGLSQYDIPFLLHPNPARVLIVGAGAGNDVAGALRHGVTHVTGVEIDPAIIRLGREFHPERPYSSSRVEVVIDDARSYFATADASYDLIVFGLLDSHTTTVMTNARLDHYVYTVESLRRARSLLAEGGVLVLTFSTDRWFVGDRIAATLKEVFGQEPLTFQIPYGARGWGGIVYVTGDMATVRRQLAVRARLSAQLESWQREHPVAFTLGTPPTTDDWPYLYLRRPMIPPLFVLLAALMVLVLLYVRSEIGLPSGMNPLAWDRSNWHFFALGAGFLLLEVQNISKASVVLGSTWQVNAVIITAVLCMILVANLIVAAWPRLPTAPVLIGLLASPVLLFFFDLGRFAFMDYPEKAVLVGGYATLPMLFSGIVFVRSFAAAPRKDVALGANLLGALCGALLEALSFLTGVRSLLLLVGAFYLIAVLTLPSGARAAVPEPASRRESAPARA